MAHSVELIFDTAGEAAIQRIWRILAAAGLPSQVQVKSDTNRPHVTLVAARHICADVDAALRALGPVLPLDCVIGAPVVFPGPRQTLARLIVPSAGLLALHERAFGLCLPMPARPLDRARDVGPAVHRRTDRRGAGSRRRRPAHRHRGPAGRPAPLGQRQPGRSSAGKPSRLACPA